MAAPKRKAAARAPRKPARPAASKPASRPSGKKPTAAARAKTPKTPKKVARKPASPPAVVAAEPSLADVAVLVIGDHPAAALCAILLKEAKIPVALLDIGATPNADRLITINPAFFGLHKSLGALLPRLDLATVTYACFLGPNGEAAQSQPKKSGSRESGVLAYIGGMLELRTAVRTAATEAGVPVLQGTFSAEAVDERGVHVRVNGQRLVPRILAVADPLPEESAGLLEVPRFPGRGSNVQATAKLSGGTIFGPAADEQALALTLDLGRQLQWGWLLRRRDEAQLCVQCPPEGDVPALLEEWMQVLRRHGVLAPEAQLDVRSLRVSDLPLGGALMRDVVARRTLLFGPAGGFYSASGEDVYPGCWSAKYAAEIAAKAVKADHPQDALGAYRGRWGATLGDYLRGPQQNLRFLLPLLYKNPVMTDRLAEAILLGESMVK